MGFIWVLNFRAKRARAYAQLADFGKGGNMRPPEKKEPKRAWRQGLGSRVGKWNSPGTDFSGIAIQTQDEPLSRAICPRYDFCSCPLCPLSPDWTNHRHLPGDPVCRWLREAVKPGSRAVLSRSLSGKSVDRVVAIAMTLISHKGPLKTRLIRAATQGSKAHIQPPIQRG